MLTGIVRTSANPTSLVEAHSASPTKLDTGCAGHRVGLTEVERDDVGELSAELGGQRVVESDRSVSASTCSCGANGPAICRAGSDGKTRVEQEQHEDQDEERDERQRHSSECETNHVSPRSS